MFSLAPRFSLREADKVALAPGPPACSRDRDDGLCPAERVGGSGQDVARMICLQAQFRAYSDFLFRNCSLPSLLGGLLRSYDREAA